MVLVQFILNLLGLNNVSEGNVFVQFLSLIILLSILIFISLLNVLFYFLIIYLVDYLRLLYRYINKLPGWVITIINFYINTRKLFIVYEVCFALFVVFSIIWLCSRIVLGVM